MGRNSVGDVRDEFVGCCRACGGPAGVDGPYCDLCQRELDDSYVVDDWDDHLEEDEEDD